MTREEIINKAAYMLRYPVKKTGYVTINGKLKPVFEYNSLEYYFDKNDREIGYYNHIIKHVETSTAGRKWDNKIKSRFHKIFLK
jgi:hypothetical protein